MERFPGSIDTHGAHVPRALRWPRSSLERTHRFPDARARAQRARAIPRPSALSGVAEHAAVETTAPPIARSPMAPRDWPGCTARVDRPEVAKGPHVRGPWSTTAAARRLVLAALVVAQTWIAADYMMSAVLPYHGQAPLELAMLVVFTILFAWISAGFWTALAGFATLMAARDRFAITRTIDDDAAASDIPHDARTAIVMPICNEDVARVFAGLRATYESLAGTGAADRFDFFVLSDSASEDRRAEEMAAWSRMCEAVDGFGRIFYRWRRHRIKRKSGNIGDFCRRWGRNYRYMVVLDADSVMTGECLTRLVLLAEANPGTGIIQTVPCASGRDTLFARVQQFASAAYGPVFTAGLHYWQLGESHYWGHNAIIRMAPFMQHCALGRLPGRGPFSGEVLSHDFVEAALMRRAGWSVWIAYDLPGSYEEVPPNLVDELGRDRRWCQGNLMNMRLLAMKGLHPAHRAVFVTGLLAYVSAPLWFVSLVLATALVAIERLTLPQYFVRPYQLFPLWPEWHPERAVLLLSATAALLFLPKILASLLVQARRHGGHIRLALSVLLECLASALLAPIRMLFHTQFVLSTLVGHTVRWRSPARADSQTAWSEAVRRHGVHTLLGLAWASAVWAVAPDFLTWLLPVVGPMILSIPLSVCTSSVRAGKAMRRLGLFLIAEETAVPSVLVAMRKYLNGAETASSPRRLIPSEIAVDARGAIDEALSRLNARSAGAIVASIETRDAGAPAVH